MLSRFLTGMFFALNLCIAPQIFANDWLSAQSNPGFNPSPGKTLSSSDFEPISFQKHTSKGNDIKEIDHRSFKLKKGSYLVTFTGTFQNNDPNIGNSNVDIGFQVKADHSSDILFVKRFFASENTGTELITTSGIIKVKEGAVLRVVALLIPLSSPTLEVAVHNRNLSIIQLDD